jgi:hypothetical protein
LVIIILLPLAGHPFLLGYAAAEPLKVTGGVVHNEIIAPVSIPEKIRLNLLSFSLILDEGGIIGGVAVYDDPTTDRSPDYCELYDNDGDLSGSVGWMNSGSKGRLSIVDFCKAPKNSRGFLSLSSMVTWCDFAFPAHVKKFLISGGCRGG